MRITLVTAAVAFIGASATANVTAEFIEGAPKDRFVITNASACHLSATAVVINFVGSAGALIFDTEGTGAGVEVFQPLEIVAGQTALSETPAVRDGGKMVSLALSELKAGEQVAFTIDVDDTIGQREITVRGTEIAGAMFAVGGQTALFGDDAMAALPVEGCEG